MYHAVNLDEIVEKAYGGAGYAGSAGHVQPGTPWYNPDVRQYAYDVETAKKMLSEAGAADSNGDGILEYNGEEMSYTLTFTENDEKLAELLVSYMKAVGIELVPQSADDATVKAAISHPGPGGCRGADHGARHVRAVHEGPEPFRRGRGPFVEKPSIKRRSI